MKIFFAILLCITAASVALGQAATKEIKFAGGSATVSGSLSNGHEATYVLKAEKGQRIIIRNSRTSQFDFRVYSEEFDLETEFESSPVLNVEVPETGEYHFFVRKKMTAPRTARYSITITVK